MERLFTRIATGVASLVGQPPVFTIALLSIIVWAATGPLFGFSDTWQLIVNTTTTIVTFLVVFLIQNSQNRDAAAMQAKLDELLRVVHGAREQLIGIEHLTEKEVEEIRSEIEEESKSENGTSKSSKTLARLRDRL